MDPTQTVLIDILRYVHPYCQDQIDNSDPSRKKVLK